MLLCKAGSLTRAHIEAWFGDHGTGFIDLFVKDKDKFVLVASNVTAGNALNHAYPPQQDTARICLRVASLKQDGEETPVFLEVRQNGARLPFIDEATGQGRNGQDPFEPVELQPWAPHSALKFYYFNVSFA